MLLMKIHQNNTINNYDCGVFVCMYAHDIESIGRINNENTCIQYNTSCFRLYMLFNFIQEINNIENTGKLLLRQKCPKNAPKLPP